MAWRASASSRVTTTGAFLLPGVVTKTGKNDAFPISQQQLVKWQDGAFIPFGKLIDTRPKGLAF